MSSFLCDLCSEKKLVGNREWGKHRKPRDSNPWEIMLPFHIFG
jgi:hypothetical protein